MHIGRMGLPWALLAAALLTPLSARAEDETERRGFELMVRPGYGSAGGKSPVVYRRPPAALADPDYGDVFHERGEPYGGGFVGELSAGYRFLPLASAGLYGQLRSSSAETPNDGSRDLSRSAWGAGFYGRFYLSMLHPSLDPYVQIGIGYAQDTQSFVRPTTVMTTAGPMVLDIDWELKHHGIVIPLGVGIGYRVIDMLSIGPSFRYDLVMPAGGCLKASASLGGVSDSNKSCTDESDNRRVTEAKSYGVWSVGLDLKLTL